MEEGKLKELKNKFDFVCLMNNDSYVQTGLDAAKEIIKFYEEKLKEYGFKCI